MKPTAFVTVLAAISLAGCGTAPTQKPRAVDAFASTPIPEPNSSPSALAKKASTTFFSNASAKAKSSDDSSDFGVKADGLAAFAIALASGGALTNSHSELYKGAGALLGLGFGANQYFKPEDQRAIYFNSAEASFCSGIHMTTLAELLEGVTVQNITDEIATTQTMESTLTGLLYSRNLVAAQLDPFTATTFVTAAVNAEDDANAKLSALKFIKSIHLQAHKRNLEIYKYEISEVNKTAFKIDDTLKTISKLSVSPGDLLKAFNQGNPGDGEANAIMFNSKVKDTKVIFEPTALAKKLPDIIENINTFNGCTAALKPVASS
ncbi:hypothetical protein [Pseudomonas sp. EA_35y_Pfl2_R5]|uniref:hypothetical protein n=1 Tax=Pseudomonas sp. EA_35y_Pfl2_R5 TaxID=3088690 RepID=UPI0030DAE8E4